MVLNLWIIYVPNIFFVQQCYIRQVHLGSLQQYRIRKNISISNHCISDNTHTNPPVNFPEVTNVIFNACNVSLDPSIDWLIDWLIGELCEWVTRRASGDWWCDCLPVWLSMQSNSFYTLLHKNLNKPWHIVTRYPLSLYQSWFIIKWKGIRFFLKNRSTKDTFLKAKKSSKGLHHLLNGGSGHAV